VGDPSGRARRVSSRTVVRRAASSLARAYGFAFATLSSAASPPNKLVRSSAGPYCRLKTNRRSCRFSSSAKNGPRRGWQYLNVRAVSGPKALTILIELSCRTNHRTIGSALLLPQMAILGDLRRAAAIGPFRPGRPGQRRNWDRVDRICPANMR
jgi:hypothetical protein